MSGGFRLHHEIIGLRPEDISDPEWIEHIKRQEKIRKKGLEAFERVVEGDGWGLPKPFFRCYAYTEHPIQEYSFKSFDDVMAFAQLLSMSNAALQSSDGLVKVQHIPSYAIPLAYVDVRGDWGNRFSLPEFFIAADGMFCTRPVTLDAIRGLVEKTVADSSRLRERRFEKEKQRREELPRFAQGKEILLPGLPEKWYGWPIAIDLSIALKPWECVYRELFWEYEARSMEDALKKLFEYR